MHGLNFTTDRDPFMMRSPFLEISSLLPGPILKREDPIPEMMAKMITDGTDPRFGIYINPVFPHKYCFKIQIFFFRLFANSVAWVEDMKGPRVIKSHLPLDFLPPDLLEKAKGFF